MIKKIISKANLDEKLLTNSVYITFSRFSRYFLMLLFTIMSSRYLGTSNYGALSYYMSRLAIISLFFTFGADMFIVIQISVKPKKANTYITENIINRIGLILITTIVIILLNKNFKILDFNIVILLLYFSYIFDSFRTVADGFYQAKEEMKYIAYIELTRTLLLIILFVIFMKLDLGLTGLAFSYFLSTLISFLISYLIMFSKFKVKLLPTALEQQLNLIKFSLPFFMNNIVNVLAMQIDIQMINSYMGDIQTAYYATAKKLIDIVLVIPGIICTLLLPRLSNGSINQKNNKKIISIIFLLGVTVSLFTFILAKYIILLLFGKEFIYAYKILRTFSIAFPIIFLNAYFGSLLSAKNKQKVTLLINVINTALNVLLNSLLIPTYYSNGAAIATVITIFTTFIMYVFYYLTKKKVLYNEPN